jgi:threonine dehydratase
MKHEKPSCRIVLCQHEDSPGFLRSIEAGKPVTELPAIKTLASGLEGGFGVKTFEVLRHRYDDIRLVSESELRDAMRWMIDHHQILIEGSSAVPIAACLSYDFLKPDGPVVIFISGRNVARETILDVLSEK